MRPLRLLAMLTLLFAATLFATPARASDAEEAQFNVVVSLYNAGQWEAALKKITEREATDLSDAMRARYLYVKGLSHENGKQLDQAAAAWGQLIARHPAAADAAKARVALIYLEYGRGKSDAVVAQCKGLNLDTLPQGDRANVALMYAEALLATNADAAATIAAYEKAKAYGADGNVVAQRLFILYMKQGDRVKLLAVSAAGVPGLDGAVVALARAEALLATGKPAEVLVETKKVPENHALYPRASYAAAQALIATGKPADAAAPLKIAVEQMKSPAAPLSAHLALVECLIAANQMPQAEAALAAAKKQIAAAPAEQRVAAQGQLVMIDVRLAGTGDDPKRLVAAIDAARGTIVKTELPKALLLRLQTLESLNDSAAIVNSMPGDLPVLTDTAQEAAARMIFYRAFVATKKGDDAAAMLATIVERHANQPEALFARLQLANAALAKNDDAAARQHFAALAAAPNAAQVLGNDAYHDVLCNLGLIALRAGDNDAAVTSLDALVKLNPRPQVQVTAMTLLGQARANKQDYANAGAAWTQALSAADDKQKLDLLDRIARVASLRGDHAAAIVTWKQLAEAAGKVEALTAGSLQAWAGAHYALKQYAEAAGLYTTIYEAHGKASQTAYEAAASFDAAGNAEQAASWYTLASKDRAKLPEAYAASLDANLASAKLRGGVDDMGREYWLGQLKAEGDESVFNRGIYATLAIINANKADAALEQKLAATAAAIPVTSDRHYAVAAVRLAALDALDKQKQLGETTTALLKQWDEHSGKLEAGRFGTTIAPAMLQFYAGEAARKRGDAIGAMVYYETILAVYPYNEWPDAAALGAARSFAATGDKDTAIARLDEIVAAEDFKTNPNRWRTQAAAMLEELKKGP